MQLRSPRPQARPEMPRVRHPNPPLRLAQIRGVLVSDRAKFSACFFSAIFLVALAVTMTIPWIFNWGFTLEITDAPATPIDYRVSTNQWRVLEIKIINEAPRPLRFRKIGRAS